MAGAGSNGAKAEGASLGGVKAGSVKAGRVKAEGAKAEGARAGSAAGRAGPGRPGKGAKPGKTAGAAERRAHFLEMLRTTANVSRAARAAGIASSTLYGQRARNAGFARAWDLAMAEALDTLEEVLIARARDGVERPVYYAGEVKGTVRVYSDQLAMFLLRARRPEIYDRATPAAATSLTVPDLDEAGARAEFERRLRRVQEKRGAA